jgi:benzoate-CoA ligase
MTMSAPPPSSLPSAAPLASPPSLSGDFPRRYNAAEDLLDRHLAAGRGDKTAYIDDQGSLSFAELAERASRFGGGLLSLGLNMEERIALILHDTRDFPVAFLGAIRAGIVPVALNTLLPPRDHEYMLADSRARALVVSAPLLPALLPLLPRLSALRFIIVAGGGPAGQSPALLAGPSPGLLTFHDVLARGQPQLPAAPTTADDACFWLYSSGSTGRPKGTVHVQSTLNATADLYAKPILGLDERDVVFSAAKLFFAYGLGNALAFPLAVGATTVLLAERPTPAAVFACLRGRRPTVFYGVPTLYAGLLADPHFPKRQEIALRICTSAGEALPEHLGRRWAERTGVDILDGIGSTEMAHIFISNRPGDVRYGTTGRVVPGYRVRVQDESGREVGPGEIGDLYVAGPTSAAGYWNQRERSRQTFQGEWTRTGDKYSFDAEGYFTYAGRSDDMLKVSGIYVSPVEVEAALSAHEAVLEAAVVGRADENQLIKPMAYVVLKPGQTGTGELVAALQAHVKTRLAPHKYPRWIEFLPELPKTATGKIQRFKLRGD